MATKLATAFVEVTTRLSPLKRGLGAAKALVVQSARGIQAALAGIGTGLAIGGVFTAFAVKAAANAEEVQNKFEAVFKDLTGDAEQFATEFATSIGRSTGETKRQLAEFQDTFVPLGFARDRAAELSKQMVTLTADLASFNIMADSEAQERLTSALVGNHEAVRKFGVVITQATLDQQLLNMGIEGGAKAASEQEKVMARLALIMQSTTDAQGDAARTAGSFTNRMKGLQGAVQDITGTFGSAFLPALANIAKRVTEVIRGFEPLVADFATTLSTWLQAIVENWRTSWEIVKQSGVVALEFLKDVWSNFPNFIAFRLGENLRHMVDWGKKIAEIAAAAGKSMIDGLFGRENDFSQNLGETLADMASAFKAGFEGKDIGAAFVEGEGLKQARGRLSSLIDDLRQSRDDIVAAQGAAEAMKDAVGGGGAQAEQNEVTKKLKVEFPTGTLGFEQLNKTIQDSFLKRDDNEKKQTALLETDKAQQASQTQVLKSIDENIKNTQQPVIAST